MGHQPSDFGFIPTAQNKTYWRHLHVISMTSIRHVFFFKVSFYVECFEKVPDNTIRFPISSAIWPNVDVTLSTDIRAPVFVAIHEARVDVVGSLWKQQNPVLLSTRYDLCSTASLLGSKWNTIATLATPWPLFIGPKLNAALKNAPTYLIPSGCQTDSCLIKAQHVPITILLLIAGCPVGRWYS